MPRLLFVGDIHLGRRPTRLPDELPGLRRADLGPAAAWQATVDLALAEGVDAVVLAGDVVESQHDRFEAYGHLQAGVQKLTGAGIPVYGVAGNHDVLALPHLAQQVPAFKLLGAGGTWEHVDLAGADGTTVRLLGWSFPAASHRRDPLEGLAVPIAEGRAVLGVLHCDLDGPATSAYAPVRRTELAARAVDGWLLGHVHRPDDLAGARPLGYLGSLSPLDPGEPGAHGPWRVEALGPGQVKATQVPLAPLRYARIELDVSEVGADGTLAPDAALESAVLAKLAEVAERCEATGAAARVILCRVVLTGRSPHHAELARAVGQGLDALQHTHAGRLVCVEKIVDDAAAALDLETLARGKSPPGLLARRLLALEHGGDAAAALIRDARARLRGVAAQPAFAELDAARLDDDDHVRQALLRAGREALERLMAQKVSP